MIMVKTKKEEFIDTADKMILPATLITICFRVYEDYLYLIPGIEIIKILVILAGNIIIIGGIIQLPTRKKARRKGSNVKKTFYRSYTNDLLFVLFLLHNFPMG